VEDDEAREEFIRKTNFVRFAFLPRFA